MTAVTVKLGQYFTGHEKLKQKIFEFILNRPDRILEPSIGRGDLIVFIKENISYNILFDMYEIDNTIELLNGITKSEVIYQDFITVNIKQKYKTIIGNPPYIKIKKRNLYIDFIEKCYYLLENNGELIFIVPSDFLKLTNTSILLNRMMMNGTFTHIFHPNNEKLFKDACIDIIIFRYCKNKLLSKKLLYNDKNMYIINTNGMITFTEKEHNHKHLFKDFFDIYVGLVSGKDSVYKNDELANIKVLNSENKIDNYIYIEKYPSGNNLIDDYLLQNKKILLQRKIRKFNEHNWFQWGAMRNIKKINARLDEQCIYINNITRKSNVAFIGKVKYFGGSLIILIPKKHCNLENITLYINSSEFKANFTFSGRFKIGHRQISNSYIPDYACYPKNSLSTID